MTLKEKLVIINMKFNDQIYSMKDVDIVKFISLKTDCMVGAIQISLASPVQYRL